ncbi:MAG: ATP-binding protein [bacterium]
MVKSREIFNELLNNKINEIRYNKRYVHKNGKIIYAEISTTLQKDEFGSPIYLISDIIDITEEFLIKAALLESEQKYKMLAETAHEGIVLISANMKLLFVNTYAANLIEEGRYKPEELLQKNIINNIFNIKNDLILEAFKVKKSVTIETETIINEEIIYLETKLVPIVKENNRADAILGIARDVTEKKIIHNKLQKTQEMLQLVINTIPQRVFWKDKNNHYLGCNKQTAQDAGFDSVEEMIGKTDYDCIWAIEAEKYIADDNEVVRLGKPKFNFEEKLKKQDGYYWIKTSKVPLFNSGGDIFAVLGVYEDITERKKTEEELKVTLDKLEKSNKELEQFANVASHDLQEPLRMVASYTQLLEKKYKDQLDESANEYIHYAVDGAMRMQILINDLLDYSRITTRGKEFTKVNLSVVLGRAIINLYNKINEKNAIVANGFLPNVWGDEVQLVRVFQNLIDNSLKYSSHLTPAIFISSEEQETEWVITVKDNGIGINEEYKEKIFKLFERLHSYNEYTGTGIGLTICKKIIERHGGRIWLDTSIKEGAAFCFTIKKYKE